MVRIRKTRLNESAKADKLFIALVNDVDKFAQTYKISTSSDSFLGLIDRLKEYYQDDEEDEIDDNDIQVLKYMNNSVLLSYKHQKYIIRLNRGSDSYTIEILSIKQNTFNIIYDSHKVNAFLLTYYFYKELIYNYVLSNNGKFYNWDAVEKMYETDMKSISDIQRNNFDEDDNRLIVDNSRLYDLGDDNKVFITYSTIPRTKFPFRGCNDLLYIDVVDIGQQIIQDALVKTFTQWTQLINM